MGGWHTIADATALLAATVLLAILMWSAHVRGTVHRRVRRESSRGGAPGARIGRAADRRWRLT
jgi:hypothetical protein